MKRRYISSCFILLLHTDILVPLFAASLGDTCSADSDCASIVNSMCYKMYDCATGVCACQSGYGNPNNNGCQKQLRGYQQSCGSSSMCSEEHQECSSTTGKCVCEGEWYTYYGIASVCSLRTYQLLTQSCGGWYNVECLIETDSGIECSGTCRCKSGYITDLPASYKKCRRPRYGEACAWSPKCDVDFDTSTISDDASNIAPSCSQNTCKCPASHEHKSVNGWHLCLSKIQSGTTLFKVGEECIHFNECETYFCVKCPGAASGICMNISTSDVIDNAANEMTMTFLPAMVIIILCVFVFT